MNLSWISDVNVPIPAFTTEELSYCCDQHSLEQTLAVWRAAHNMFYDTSGGGLNRDPFPGIHAIILSLISYWNHSKGGVDVVSRYLTLGDSPFHHISIEASFWDRLVMLALLNTFSIGKIVDIVEDGDLNEIQSTDALAKRSRSGRTFHSFLGSCFDIFGEWAATCGHVMPIPSRIQPSLGSQDQHHASCILTAPVFELDTTVSIKRIYYDTKTGYGSRTSNTYHIPITTKAAAHCAIKGCSHRTSYYCEFCQIHLCIQRHSLAISCFMMQKYANYQQ